MSPSSLAVSWMPLCGSLRLRITASCVGLFTCEAVERPSVGWVLLRSRGATDGIQISTSVASAAYQQTVAGCALHRVIYYSKVLRADSYSVAPGSARSGTCDPAVFSPEKISPDSVAAGREHAGWDVCFLPLLFVSMTFFSTNLFLFFFSVWSSTTYSHFCISLIYSPSSSFTCVSCQCSVSCGGGVQTRTVQCLRQGRPAAGCLPYQRPVTSRACNTQFCPPAAPVPAQIPGRVATASGSTLKGKIHLKASCIHVYLFVLCVFDKIQVFDHLIY